MAEVMTLYLDDSGTRHPDLRPNSASEADWFALGGVLVRDADIPGVEEAHAAFCARWKIAGPLHSSEIRSRSKHFKFLRECAEAEAARFYDELTAMITAQPLTVFACVIDRPGYDHRYRVKYRQRWSLCRSAFNIVVERAAKFVVEGGARMRVYVEMSDRKTDRKIQGYYDDLCTQGHPFDRDNAAKYSPMDVSGISRVLYELRFKDKSSRLMQLADVCLYPVCANAYGKQQRPYDAMEAAGMLIDCKVDAQDIPKRGIKYYCWDLRDAAAATSSSGHK